MARGGRPLLGLALLLLAGSAAAQAPLMAQAGDLLMMLTDAIEAAREVRNVTGSVARRAGAANPPGPISDAPFSARVTRLRVAGGPQYEWSAATTASPSNVSVTSNETVTVKFQTRYTRSVTAFEPYSLHGQVELRNLQPRAVTLEGPVKILITLKRPAGVTTGPESVESTHFASCGKSAPTRVPPARKNTGAAGVVRCNFDAVLPQAVTMMEAAEAAMAAALGAAKANGTVTAASAEAADELIGAKAEALMPEVSLVVQAAPALPASAAPAAPAALMAPYQAAMEIPAGACLAVSQAIAGPLAKFVQPTGSYLPTGLRTICAAGGVHTYIAKLGGFDASSCGTHALRSAPAGGAPRLGGGAEAEAEVTVTGCSKVRYSRPEVTLTRLEAVRVVNYTWSAEVTVTPIAEKGANASAAAAAGGALALPADGSASAVFTVKLTKSAPLDLGNRLRGEVAITTTSVVPEVMPAVRLAVTSPGRNATYIELRCPPLVSAAGVRCAFDAPWNATKIGSVQVQLKSITAKGFDVTSGTPRPFDFSSPASVVLGDCVSAQRAYVGESAIAAAGGSVAVRPLANLVNGMDALMGAVRLNISRLGLPKDTFGELLGLAAPAGDASKAFEGLSVRRLARRLLAGLAGAAAPASAASAGSAAAGALLPYLHPLKAAGGVPPAPGSKTPLRVCKTETLSWTESFGGAPASSCGSMYNALSTLTFAPEGPAAAAQPPLARNVSLPVVVAGCSARPTLKLLALRAGAAREYTWGVASKALDKKVIVPEHNQSPVVAKYVVAYNRTSRLANFTLEPAVVLLNPFSAPVAVEGVTATVVASTRAGERTSTVRLTCKGAGAGLLALPPAPSPSTPVPIGCIGTVPLPAGASAGTITVAAKTAGGEVTVSEAFDLRGAPVDVVSGPHRCIQVDSSFKSDDLNGVLPLVPSKFYGSVPKGGATVCDSTKFTFIAEFPTKEATCGSYLARFVANIVGQPKTSTAYTPIAIHDCRK